MDRRIQSLTLGLLLFAKSSFAADEETIKKLLDDSDDVTRSAASVAVMEMHVKTERYERTMKMKTWSQGTEKSLIQILEPAKDAGTATLKVDDNLWNYLPKVDRTMKVPAGMMSGSWNGSHFSNDDLVKESRLSEEFLWEVLSEPTTADPKKSWIIKLVPKPDVAVVWGKIVIQIRADRLPEKTEFFDEAGTLVRTMAYLEIKEMDGKQVPSRMLITPADKPGEFTEIRYIELDLDATLDANLFTLQALKR